MLEMDLIQIPHYAILSGLFGTAASVFGKLISYSDEVIENLTIDSSQNVCRNFHIYCIESKPCLAVINELQIDFQ